MSRCFPYPPPGLLRQGSVESIKIQRERVVPKTEQKLHKKREKEKKKDKKGSYGTPSPTQKFKKLDYVQNGYEVDQLEKSDLTEEHEPPVGYISDGSQSSHKRKRESISYSECRVEGNKIKIKFSLKKPRQSDSSVGGEPSTSSNGRVDSNQNLSFVPPVPEQNTFYDNGRKGQYPSSAFISSAPSCSVAPVPEQKLRHNDGKEQGPYKSLLKDSNIRRAAFQYKTLIEDWLPSVLQPELNDEDSGDDWLLPKKQRGEPVTKISDGNDVPCCASSTSWPQAHYLGEVEVYALPYTVPF